MDILTIEFKNGSTGLFEQHPEDAQITKQCLLVQSKMRKKPKDFLFVQAHLAMKCREIMRLPYRCIRSITIDQKKRFTFKPR